MSMLGPMIRGVVGLVSVLGLLFAGGVTVGVLMYLRRKSTGSTAGWASQVTDAITAGNIPAHEAAVLANGTIGEATILDRMEVKRVAKNRTMIYTTWRFVLEVQLPGQAAYRAPCEQEFIGSESSLVLQGNAVPVRVDGASPQVVYIDRAALTQRAQTAHAADREAHAKRQAELLGRR